MNTLVRTEETRSGPRLPLWSLRVAATVHLVVVLAQPVLAGLFLTGDVDAITAHGTVGGVLAVVTLVLIGATLAYVLRRGRLWVLPAVVALFLAVGIQIGLGYSRTLAVHVPLGVAIVAASLLLAVWVWTPAAARPRGGAR